MKKYFITLCAMMAMCVASFTSMAALQQVYVCGGINGQGWKPGPSTIQLSDITDGWFKLDVTSVGEFKVSSTVGSTDADWTGFDAGAVKFDLSSKALNAVYDKNGGSSGNSTVPAGTKVIYFSSDLTKAAISDGTWTPDAYVESGDDPNPSTYTISVDVTIPGWTSVKCHYWGGNTSAWPGKDMTDNGNGIWSITLDQAPENILFHNGDGDQSVDFTFTDGKTYVLRSRDANQKNYWCEENGDDPNPDPQPSELKFFADLNGAGAWTASALTGGKYTFTVTKESYFTFTTDGDWSGAWRPASPNAGKDYLISANGTVQAIASGSDGCFKITAPGTYTVTPNASANSFTISGFGGDDPTPVPGDDLYIIGYVDGKDFSNTDYGIKQSSQTGKVYKWNSVLVGDAGAGLGYFNIATIIGQTGTSEDWDNFINNGIRYGAATKDAPLSVTTPADVKAYIPDVDCSACRSWAVEPGTYAVTLDLGAMKISLSGASGIEDVEINDNAPAVYYNFQGVRVDNPEGGMFIEVRGNKARKVVK